MTVTLWLLLAALLSNGVLAGSSLDQSIKQLPARRRIGVVAYSEYSKAGDLGHGVAWLAALGVGAAVLTVVAALVGLLARPEPLAAAALVVILVLTLAHSFVTTRAAPTNFSQRAAAGDAARLAVIFDRFERWQTIRAALQLLTLVGVGWALAAEIG